MSQLPPSEEKEVLKQALKEWLDEKYAAVGRWTVGTVISFGLFALVYYILQANGWRPPV